MKTPIRHAKTLIAIAVASVILNACSSSPVQPEVMSNARNKLTQLQSDPQLSRQAPVAIKDAEDALRAAEGHHDDKAKAAHLMYIAERKVDTAQALAESRLLVDQRAILNQQRESARLDSRTQEADSARSKAETARMETLAAQQETDSAHRKSESDRLNTLAAQQQTADAQQEAAKAQQEAADLQRQIAELNAKPTERGLVVTLGDVLFDTDKAELKSGAATNLAKLSSFLKQYPDRSVLIEGHTDSVGNDDYNLGLSQRRADVVKVWLMNQGVDSTRLVTSGKGESSPVAGNDNASGRQLNRRVEVIIENTDKSQR
jgi:outer membrane protein OmpA-like peptidoglycan-associated protein